jgi:hypothetical protein
MATIGNPYVTPKACLKEMTDENNIQTINATSPLSTKYAIINRVDKDPQPTGLQPTTATNTADS